MLQQFIRTWPLASLSAGDVVKDEVVAPREEALGILSCDEVVLVDR
jgi:hypothetical protein